MFMPAFLIRLRAYASPMSMSARSTTISTWHHSCDSPHPQIPPNQTYKSPGEAYVEGDASSASYFLAGATITGGTMVVEGCGSASLQGDVRFAEVMGLMGARVEWSPYSIRITGPKAFGQPLKAIDHDCNDIPDAAMTAAVAALFADG